MAPLLHYIWWLAAFFLIFLRVKSDASWTRIVILTGSGVGFITALAWIMVLDFPHGLLRELYVLPWPIG